MLRETEVENKDVRGGKKKIISWDVVRGKGKWLGHAAG